MNRENHDKDLLKEISSLQEQLHEVTKTLNEIKSGNIDALIVSNNKEHKVYAEQSADKTYRVLIEKMNEGAIMLNASGTILYCNSHFASMVSMPMQKIIGTQFKIFIDEASTKLLARSLKQKNDGSIKEEVLLHASNKKTLPVLMSLNTLSINNHTTLSIILTDLTIQNKNQAE